MTSALLTQEEVDEVQNKLGMIAQFCSEPEFVSLLSKYCEQSRPYCNGTMDTLLPHVMSLSDIDKAKMNLTYLREVGLRCIQISDMRTRLIERSRQ